MNLRIFAVAWLACVVICSSNAQQPVVSTRGNFEDFKFLVGGIWHGEAPALDQSKPLQIQSHFDWTENHQAIRFDSSWIFDGKPYPYTSGIYLYDPAKKSMRILYSDAEGGFTDGTVENNNGVLEHALTVTDKDGKSELVRTRLSRQDDGSFVNQILRMKDGKWQTFIEVHYRRAQVP